MSEVIFQPKGRIMKGDELSSLTSSKPGLLQNIFALWGKDARITCGSENRFAVIFQDGTEERIIALAKLIEIQTGKGVIIGMLHDVVTDGEFEGRGLATGLMKLLLHYGREHDFAHFELTCRPTREAANHIYQKLGFTLMARAEGERGTNLYRYIFQ